MHCTAHLSYKYSATEPLLHRINCMRVRLCVPCAACVRNACSAMCGIKAHIDLITHPFRRRCVRLPPPSACATHTHTHTRVACNSTELWLLLAAATATPISQTTGTSTSTPSSVVSTSISNYLTNKCMHAFAARARCSPSKSLLHTIHKRITVCIIPSAHYAGRCRRRPRRRRSFARSLFVRSSRLPKLLSS